MATRSSKSSVGSRSRPSSSPTPCCSNRPTIREQVLEEIASAASAVVVMAQTARRRLCSRFDVDPSKVTMIPHGAATPAPRATAPSRRRSPAVAHLGPARPGKGDRVGHRRHGGPEGPCAPGPAMSSPVARTPRSSRRRARPTGTCWWRGHGPREWPPSVTFDPAYRDLPSLTRLIQDASVVVLPYDSRDQVTSGRARRRPRRRQAGRGDRLPPRRGTAVERGWHGRPPRRRHRARRCAAPLPHRARSLRGHGARGGPSRSCLRLAGSWHASTPTWPTSLLVRVQGSTRLICPAAQLRAPGANDRRARHVRARRPYPPP